MSDTHGGQSAGWYPDPEMAETVRYWDGAGWTDHRAPASGQLATPATESQAPVPPPEAATAPSAPKQKSNRIGFVVAGCVVGLLVLIYAVAAATKDDSPTHPSRPLDLSVTVVYEVEGTTDSADITAETPTGTSQQSDVAVPMTNKAGNPGLTFTFQLGDFVYISAQNKEARGTVTCRITVDGEVVSENSASGAYAIATCQGNA